MTSKLTRRDFLKFGGLSAASLAFSPLVPASLGGFDDSDLIRVATNSVSVYKQPSDKSIITGTWYRDDLVHVYGQVTAEEPTYNPVWYQVWGGYMHRSRIQRVKTIFQTPVVIPEGTRRLAEVTVPFTRPYRFVKARQHWEALNPPLYYGSVHWVDQLTPQGFDGSSDWYRILDELDSNVPYFVSAKHLHILSSNVFDPITPNVPYEEKLIKVNLTTQILTAYEYGSVVFQTNISSGIPGGGGSGPKAISTTTPNGKFEILDKVPSKHMGNSYFNLGENGNLLADVDNYVLPGVPWTCFFTEVGHAFHGTYWHENFGSPMSHGCINMRSNEANWLFRWARPLHKDDAISNHAARGTQVEIHY
jgi:lipoprotein-anchoring transpeptidase ErfK/SrfK